jgi:hypothetical protein
MKKLFLLSIVLFLLFPASMFAALGSSNNRFHGKWELDSIRVGGKWIKSTKKYCLNVNVCLRRMAFTCSTPDQKYSFMRQQQTIDYAMSIEICNRWLGDSAQMLAYRYNQKNGIEYIDFYGQKPSEPLLSFKRVSVINPFIAAYELTFTKFCSEYQQFDSLQVRLSGANFARPWNIFQLSFGQYNQTCGTSFSTFFQEEINGIQFQPSPEKSRYAQTTDKKVDDISKLLARVNKYAIKGKQVELYCDQMYMATLEWKSR